MRIESDRIDDPTRLLSTHRSDGHQLADSPTLLLPQEILQLPTDDEIIMVEGMPPIRARKIRYYEEPVFQNRLRPPVIVPPIEPIIRDFNLTEPPAARDLGRRKKNAA